jgi:glycine/D-amino acid oxidase-like deaminating enzyme
MVDHTRLGYWIEEAGEAAPAAPLEGEREADVVVLGGGYTGLWSAWYLKQLEPEARVVLLESEEVCGRGPSGRNGGFCHGMWHSAASLRDRWGAAEALAILRAADEGVARIGAFCEEQDVDAWWLPAPYIETSTAPAQDGAWERAIAAAQELGAPEAMRELTPAEVQERCASPAFRAGSACLIGAATVQPARLALGIRRRIREEGVEVFESSPVRSLRSEAGGVVATTEGGTVRAGRAVVALGSAARGRRGPLRNSLTVASSHIVITEPVPDLLEEIGWTGGEAITDCRALLHYFRTTPDGRIVFGWGGGRIAFGARTRGRAEVDADVIAANTEHLYDYFPGLRGRRLTHAWGGPIDASPTHLPTVTTLKGGRAFAAAGYTGNGVGPSNMVGRALAALALDRDEPEAKLAFVDGASPRVPPEPFHWVGGESIRRAIEAKEEAEMAGRAPGKVASAIAKVPELIGFHIGR